jgi:hypothetical protein
MGCVYHEIQAANTHSFEARARASGGGTLNGLP